MPRVFLFSQLGIEDGILFKGNVFLMEHQVFHTRLTAEHHFRWLHAGVAPLIPRQGNLREIHQSVNTPEECSRIEFSALRKYSVLSNMTTTASRSY